MHKIIMPWLGCTIVFSLSMLLFLAISGIASHAAGNAWEGICPVEYRDDVPYYLCPDEEGEALSEDDELQWFRANQPNTAQCAIVHGTFSSVKCTFEESE